MFSFRREHALGPRQRAPRPRRHRHKDYAEREPRPFAATVRRLAQRRLEAAGFPAIKTLDDFDRSAQASAERPLVLHLAQLAGSRRAATASARQSGSIVATLPRARLGYQGRLDRARGGEAARRLDAVRLPQLSVDAPRPVVSSDWTKTRPIRDASSASASTRRDGHAAATRSSRRDWRPSTLHDRMLCLLRLDQPKGHGRRSVSGATKVAASTPSCGL